MNTIFFKECPLNPVISHKYENESLVLLHSVSEAPVKMRLLLISVFAAFAVFCGVDARPEKRETFHGDKVISVIPKDEKQLLVLQVSHQSESPS